MFLCLINYWEGNIKLEVLSTLPFILSGFASFWNSFIRYIITLLYRQIYLFNVPLYHYDFLLLKFIISHINIVILSYYSYDLCDISFFPNFYSRLLSMSGLKVYSLNVAYSWVIFFFFIHSGNLCLVMHCLVWLDLMQSLI